MKDKFFINDIEGHVVVDSWEEDDKTYKFTGVIKSKFINEFDELLGNELIEFKLSDKRINGKAVINSNGGYGYYRYIELKKR